MPETPDILLDLAESGPVEKGRALMTGLVGPGGPLWEKSDPRFFPLRDVAAS